MRKYGCGWAGIVTVAAALAGIGACATQSANPGRRPLTRPLPEAAPSTSHAPAPSDVFVNSIGMKFATIPAGQFTMGSPADEPGREEDERQHVVRITRPFRLSVTEVTQTQWIAVMGLRRGAFEGRDRPVEQISWQNACTFCEQLSRKEGRTYRLPTEAEWEYACRAGSGGLLAGGDALDEIAWYDANADGQTHPVGQKKPNAWGLYDMHGNVAEWCADYYAPPYPTSEVSDPLGPAEGKARVVRGGSWASFERGCRCASRGSAPENYQLKTVGFRVVLDVSSSCVP
jgi:formylglycine-generating enzyme required for sulfatase activity